MIKNLNTIIILLFIDCISISSQQCNIIWEKVYEGSQNEQIDGILFKNNEITFLGLSSSADQDFSGLRCKGFNNLYFIQTNVNGTAKPIKCVDNPNGMLNFINSYVESDDSCLIALSTYLSSYRNITGYNGNNDIYLVKFNLDGVIIWQKFFGESNHDCGYDLIKTEDNNYLLTGYIEKNSSKNGQKHQTILIKFKNNGDIIWKKELNSKFQENSTKIIKNNKNEYYLIGKDRTNYPPVLFLKKLDYTGNVLWTRKYDKVSDSLLPKSLLDRDGNIIIISNTQSNPISHINIQKIDGNGKIIWQNVLDNQYSLHVTSIKNFGNDYYLIATTGINDIPRNYLIKFNNSGSLISNKELIEIKGKRINRAVFLKKDEIICGGDAIDSNGGKDFWLSRIELNE